jgi:hypothetical protein
MYKRFITLILAFLMVVNPLGCGGSQTIRSIAAATDDDASVLVSSDVPLLGLPDSGVEDTPSQASDAPLFVPNNQNGELIVPLRQDATAPFNGVLFNGPAVARVSVEFQAQQQRCQIERNHDVGLVVARYNADVASLRLAMDTQERTANVLLSGRDQDIARLNRLLQTQTAASSGPHVTEGLIWAGGGLLVGVLVVGGIVVFANSHP